ncbi:MAG: hypothetical protein A3D37_00485 [Candidatus Zambryskibacteria bacterium RIFCSPHIGHO2_02_FULL_38_22]|uniref:Hydroxyacid dehydrogenase n=1 Tax=Candidatus Zambryskibacteria bacterium RIFCSPLOWO2_12_FULL_39_16 TaxID=1802775 RepID=A0A1G2URZ8_9BACT|nr:MAG: hypothetical protein A3D37_00485 [Candidatus Zambryskibacteria bacterium RIFCSPHIGHO2_02_FULL_38_22]OHB08898.1 MAG: hypothetical protein A3I19_02675 [Candidatus Zambryskibacteria bacterium RIFCSPLOWO2_02_FULL_38_13]OHB12148.1 MAG: hypothetical protein A3G46_02840 [Candidatus Zambryskibacteria bacterium RIFCSPLOWO2_12_FULL_39_16]
MNILYLYKEEWEKKYVGNRLTGHNISFAEFLENVTADILSSAEVISVFVNHSIQKEDMDKMPNLKLITTRSTGFDHIDIVAAREKNIEVVYVPSYGENTVAEFAFALLLALSRKIPEAHEQVTKTGSFNQSNLRGFDLKGKTIGVIGTGRIGVRVIKMAKGFDMNVLAYDPFPKKGSDSELGFEYVGFEELLNKSDIISIHSSLSDSTRHMINEKSIKHTKKGAVLINTARGGLIETSALVNALKEEIISAAGIDVLEEEGDMIDEEKLLINPHPNMEELKNVLANHYLIDHPRVIITPHIAFNTDEAVKRILDTTIENISSFVNGQIKNKVP